MEKIPQPQNDIKPEEILNPKQPELLNVSFEYQNEMSEALVEKAVLPRLSEEESAIYDEIATQKYDTPDSFLGKVIMWAHPPHKEEEITPEMYVEQTADAQKYLKGDEEKPASANPNHIDKADEERLEKQMSVFTRAVELMKDYLKEHPKVAKMLYPAIVASGLAGCAGMPNMVQTGMYGMQQTMQAGMYGNMQANQAQMYGNMQAQQTAQSGSFQAQSSYDGAMQRAAQNRINTYNSLRRQATAEEAQRIEAQYQNEVNYAQTQAQQIQAQAQFQAQQIAQASQMQAQQIRMSTQMQQQQIQMSVTGQILNQAISGIIYGGNGGWHR